MSFSPAALPPEVLQFLRDRHLATLTTLRPDGSPHVVAVGFTYRDGVARVITDAASQKALNAGAGGRAVVAQVDGARWLSLEGQVEVSPDPTRVALAVELHTQRYKPPRVNPTRVVLEITVDRVLGRA